MSLSQGGSESGTVHVYDVAMGQERAGDAAPHVHGGTARGDLAWARGNGGFWHTRYPHAGERPEQDLAFYQQGDFAVGALGELEELPTRPARSGFL